MATGVTGHPGQHAVSLVVEELNQEHVCVTFLLHQMGDWFVLDLVLKMEHVTPSLAREGEVSSIKYLFNVLPFLVISLCDIS